MDSRRPSPIVPVLALTALLALPSTASAYGSYGSDVETGSAIGLSVIGGLFFIPTAIILANPPLTTQTIVGRALVIAGSLTAIGFSAWYFISDDPRWIPHAFGWGAGGGLIATGLILVVADDSDEDAAQPEESGEGAPTDAPPGSGEPTGPEPAAGGLGFAPFAAPGGLGLILSGTF